MTQPTPAQTASETAACHLLFETQTWPDEVEIPRMISVPVTPRLLTRLSATLTSLRTGDLSHLGVRDVTLHAEVAFSHERHYADVDDVLAPPRVSAVAPPRFLPALAGQIMINVDGELRLIGYDDNARVISPTLTLDSLYTLAGGQRPAATA